MMPIAGLIPCAFWNSTSVASEHTSVPGAAWAVTTVEHTAVAIIPGGRAHLHQPRIVTSTI